MVRRLSMTRPFIIYALPRSRTFWLSQFLSCGEWRCGHDEIRHVRGLDDVKSMLDMPHYGSVETAAAPWWRLIHSMRPDLKAVVVRRPVPDVLRSLVATGIAFDRPKLAHDMWRLDAKLHQIEARVPGVISVQFDDLSRKDVCAQIYRHCTGQELPDFWFEPMNLANLTADLEGMLRYIHAHTPQLERVARLAKQRILFQMSRRRVVSDAMTYQQEPLDVCIADGKSLFARHAIEVGEDPNFWEGANLDLMRNLESIGALYITTARCNGRMYGYLMSLIAPRLDKLDRQDGVQTIFFASPEIPGVGLKLQRASIELMRGLGVERVILRAGTRGAGERTSSIFRRLGAQDAGQMFTLDLKETS